MCSILLSTVVSQESLQVYFQSYVMEMTRLRSVIHPVWALLPSIATIFCLSFLPYYFPANTPTHKRLFPNGKASDIFTTTLPFLKEHPALNPLLVPLYYFFALPVCSWAAGKDEAAIRWQWIVFGMWYVDTIEYVRHYIEHYFPYLYNLAHKEHHQTRPIDTVFTFRNSEYDIIFPTIQWIVLVVTGISFKEAVILASLASAAAYCDHTLTGNKEYDKYKGHNIHHTIGIETNYQQPFFNYYDVIFGTLHPKTHRKWNPFWP